MQISVFGFLGDGAGRSPVDAYVEELARSRDEGFARVWTAQLPYEPDLLVTLAVALRDVPGINVGTGVLPIQVEHPMAMAQRALTVSLISGGRLTLGLGLSHRAVTERVWGVPWDRPIRRMGEYLDGLLPLLDGRKADAAGETVTTRGSLRIDAPRPDVYIAALGAQMLRLAGRRASGTVTWMTGPRTLAEHVGPTLRGAAEDAGRPVRRGPRRRLPARERDRRRGRCPHPRRGTVRDLRPLALLPRHARPRGLPRPAGRRPHR